jgi:hypothetical protein
MPSSARTSAADAVRPLPCGRGQRGGAVAQIQICNRMSAEKALKGSTWDLFHAYDRTSPGPGCSPSVLNSASEIVLSSPRQTLLACVRNPTRWDDASQSRIPGLPPGDRLGAGKRMFSEADKNLQRLQLLESESYSNGIQKLVYAFVR